MGRLALAGCGPWLVAFWHCGTLGFAPSRLTPGWAWSMFNRIFALWACISLHFGLVGVHFLTSWPCRLSFPCLLAAWAFISLYIGAAVASFWGPPHKSPKTVRFPIIRTKGLSAQTIRPMAPAGVLARSTNDFRSYPERPLTFWLQAQTIFDHTHSAR